MAQTIARIKRNGKNYEILVDLDEALKIKKGTGNILNAVITDSVFHNLKSGEHASSDDLKKIFDTDIFEKVCEKIIKNGEIVLPSEYIKKEHEQKYKQIVDFIVKNAVDKNSRPYTPDRIIRVLEESHVNIQNKPIEMQISGIIEQINKIIPIKIEMKRIKITVPSQYTGKAYGIIHPFIEKEEWIANGDLEADIKIGAGLLLDFYDKLNSVTHGSSLAEEMKN